MNVGAYATVAVPSPLRRTFDYAIPAALRGTVARGCRVVVPFARGRQVGVVLRLTEEPAVDASRVRPLAELLDTDPLLPEPVLALLEWAAGYYHHPVGEVMQSALPTLLRRLDHTAKRGPRQWSLTAAGASLDHATLGRARRQREALELLGEYPGLQRSEVEALAPGAGAALASLARKGLVSASEHGEVLPALDPEQSPDLNEAQQAAVTRMCAASGFDVMLLHGVTGSGKTEVYLRFAAACLARGHQVLVLVPEIGLTPQMVNRFRRRLGATLVTLHSGLASGARRNAWLAARAGRAQVVLGTRSSVFTPMPRLGAIVVDEEHDLSYKQQDGFRYSARDVAVMRARRADVPIVLGSATPALESMHNTLGHRSTRLELATRAGGARMPTIQIVDIRAERLRGHLSAQLLSAIRTTLDAGQQVLLFVNRRGFAPALLCHECGHVHDCPRCDAHLVVHRGARQLRCHHCGRESGMPSRCADCGSSELRPVGLGTERLEAELGEQFPDVQIERIDRDTTRRRGALEQSLERARSGATQILVGTQMLAKGHDFPSVTLVGILDADSGLFSTDFRASERLAQLVLQVAGRAGRSNDPGRVLIQTHQPDHPLLTVLTRQNYGEFAGAALAERAAASWPPHAALALLRAEAPDSGACEDFLREAALTARALTPDSQGVQVLGPVPAPMERRMGRRRYQLLFSAASRGALHELLTPLATALETMPQARRVRWSLDVDPQDLT
ncbi:MAG: primosomal protein N' [Pseudomonadota bacterium]